MLPNKLSRFMAVIITLIISGTLLLSQGAIAKQLDKWQILPRPERFTQLYFAKDAHPIRTASEGGKQKLAFIVQNFEHQTTSYRYKIFATSEDATFKKLLASGSLQLHHEQAITTHRTLSLPKLDARMAVIVELEYTSVSFGDTQPTIQNQSIHYWLETFEKNIKNNRSNAL